MRIGTYGHICVLLTGTYELCDSCNNLLPERMLESVEMNRMHVCLKGYKHQLQNDASWLLGVQQFSTVSCSIMWKF